MNIIACVAYFRSSVEESTSNLTKLFEGTVGCDGLVAKLSNYQQTTARAKKQGKDPRTLVPTNFVFKGPPGKLRP